MPKAKYKKRKDGRYCANIQTGYDEITGKRKFKTIYAYSIADLERKKADIIVKLEKGILVEDKGITVEQWANKWIDTYKTGKSYKTYQMYDNVIRNHINKELGSIKVKDLKQIHIQKLINDRHAIGRTRLLEQIKITINQILESAIDNNLIYKNVCRSIEMPSKIKKEKRALYDYEKSSLKKADLTLMQSSLVNILYYCGLRRGEVLGLTKNDIKNDKIDINKTLVFEKNKGVIKPMPKSEAGIRKIPIPKELNAILTPYLNSINTLYLFTKKDGTIMTESSFRKLWTRIINKMNIANGGTDKLKTITGLTPHVFRHNYATFLYYAGIKIKDAQYLLGHKSVDITLNIYTHLDKENNETIQKLDSYFASQN
ncbi:MAG: site-specific integrase [Vallitalea sp.]|jgi:integrase|nr:site-specific integrase [Vallitalea sp.]